jgi:hypothetical protein
VTPVFVKPDLRFRSVPLSLLLVFLVSACDFWPKNLDQLAESINARVSGRTTAWLVSGDIIVIDVAGSPLYSAAEPDLEAVATEIAEQAIGVSEAQLESIAITFHEGEISDDPNTMREFIFLVMENRPVLQPDLDFDATGPLTPDEVHSAIDNLGDSLTEEQKECARQEMEKRAVAAGDPQTLDPASHEFLSDLPAENWAALDAFGKRIILIQALTTEAVFFCIRTPG